MKSAAFIALAALMAAPACAANVESSSRTASDRSRTMVHSVVIDAPVREVWGALTTPEGWQRWAVPIAWQTSRRPRIIETSYDLKARPGDPQTIRQLFVREVPYRLLEYRTIKAPRGFADFETYTRVVNRVELTPMGRKKTRLTASSGPFPDTDAGRKFYGFFIEGNGKTFENMADVLGGHQPSRFAKGED